MVRALHRRTVKYLGGPPAWYEKCNTGWGYVAAGRTEEPMHELSLATEVYRLCRSRVERGAASRIERVKLAVGELAAVEPDLLRFAWQAVIADGPDAGAVLEIEWREAIQMCDGCGARVERAAPAWHTDCPACGRPLRVEGGRELDLLEFSYSPAPSPAGSFP
jgi:hydrogenase nickel incorporation protein HypA/HybF